MESELMPCPVCGSEVRYDYPSLKCKDRCYSMKGDFKPTLDAHNTLARHAAIGRLVEELSGANVGVSIPPNTGGAAILDALRALKKEEWSQ